MKYIFLDLDGVLNICSGSKTTFLNTFLHFDLEIINIFNFFLSENKKNIRIIISSSWRDDMEDMKSELKKAGFEHNDLIVGHTELGELPRGIQIRNYINNNNIIEYVVIDDIMDEISEELNGVIPKNRCVKTKSNEGLTNSLITELNEKLLK